MEIMHIFATVVEEASLNQAAKKLNISQPALSRKISKFEEQLGVSLFNRTGNRLKLTPIGFITYEYALEMIELDKKFQKAVSDYKNGTKKSVTIGASLTTLQSTLPELIQLITKDSPETDIKAITGKTHEILTLVKKDRVDFGLVASKVEDKDIHCEPLFDDYLQLVIPKEHELSVQKIVNTEDLDKLPMILFSKGTLYRILMEELFHHYKVYPEIKMEIDSFEAILRLVSTLRAATLLPHSYLRDSLIEDNDLMVINFKELKQTVRTTSLIYKNWDLLDPTTQNWIQTVKVQYQTYKK
ncbi:LysR family transcriptional regulator [Chengkuizengella axinellae]|uniref:LysR family transcriptional regulator n=1 Tax=Chengkuizengella axinellae TaxID=3064388 RepID=A0ABT9ITA8_9BACL|nr:LysR family transcriptional regulator [Chengkuizengella sp. 2205SS18-9]MDP5272590.1 LysR family transcriptional regulator [Chengkuizengella sp. 2205SS18-9]